MNPLAKLLPGILFVAGVIGLVLEQGAVSRARAENLQLRSDLQLVESLSSQNGMIANLRAEQQEAARLRSGNHDIHKLRNDVRLLRDQVKQLPALQAENSTLRAAAASRPSNAAPPPAQSDLIRTEQLSFAGYAAPEATFQTMLWSLGQGNVEKLLRCFPPEVRDKMTEKVNNDGIDQLKQEFSKFKSFRVAARRKTSDQEIQLGLQLEIEGDDGKQEVALPFRLVGSEWKIAVGF